MFSKVVINILKNPPPLPQISIYHALVQLEQSNYIDWIMFG